VVSMKKKKKKESRYKSGSQELPSYGRAGSTLMVEVLVRSQDSSQMGVAP